MNPEASNYHWREMNQNPFKYQWTKMNHVSTNYQRVAMSLFHKKSSSENESTYQFFNDTNESGSITIKYW